MRYKNLNTGAETDQFSEKDWKSGQPQRAGWVETGKEPKSIPKEIIDTVFKPTVREPKEVIEPVISETKAEIEPLPEAKVEKVAVPKVSKPKIKSNDNPKQTRRASGKH
jgi:hypothetical protein